MSNRRILLVDDNREIHNDFELILQPRQPVWNEQLLEQQLFGTDAIHQKTKEKLYEIDHAFCGEEALLMVGQAQRYNDPYALVFVDGRMPPGIDGIETIKRMWAIDRHIQVVMCTAFSDYSLEQISDQLGESDSLLFLRKPFDSVVVKSLASTLTRKWLLDRANRNRLSELQEIVEERTEELKLLVSEKEYVIRQVEREMDFAQVVQRQLLPPFLPRPWGVQICARYIPAGKVSGDYYDVRLLGDNHLAMLVCDVSGHGMPAALVTSVAKHSFSTAFAQNNQPEKILAVVNNELYACTPANMFVTAFLLVWDLQNRIARYVSAGHPAGLLVRSNGKQIDELSHGTLMLGVQKDLQFEAAEVELFPDDLLFLYTDGLTEVVNEQQVILGKDRLKQLLSTKNDKELKEIVDYVQKENADYAANCKPVDDVCILAALVHDDELTSIVRRKIPAGVNLDEMESFWFNDDTMVPDIIARSLGKMAEFGFNAKVSRRMRVVMIELLINAIRHGNKYNPEKVVRGATHVDEDRFVIVVIDEGEGFDPAKVPSPVSQDRLFLSSGRGIYIVNSYVDSVRFFLGGRAVIAEYKKKRGD